MWGPSAKCVYWNKDKCFSRAFNNLAVLVFYCRLQLIQHSLTNGLIPPPLPRIPTNLEKISHVIIWKSCSLLVPKLFRQNAVGRETVHISVTPLRRVELILKQFKHNIRIPHSYLLIDVRNFCPIDILKLETNSSPFNLMVRVLISTARCSWSRTS